MHVPVGDHINVCTRSQSGSEYTRDMRVLKAVTFELAATCKLVIANIDFDEHQFNKYERPSILTPNSVTKPAWPVHM